MFMVNVISNYEKTKFGIQVFERNNRGQYRLHEGIEVKYTREDAQKMAKEIESKLTSMEA